MQQQRSRDRRFLVPVALLLMTSLSDTISANAILLGGDNRWEAVNDNQAGPSINHGVPGSYWRRLSVFSGSVSHGIYCDLFRVIRRTTEVYLLASNVTKMVSGSSFNQNIPVPLTRLVQRSTMVSFDGDDCAQYVDRGRVFCVS